MNLIGVQLLHVDHIFNGLRSDAREVLESDPGVATFDAQPPSAPDELSGT